MLVDRRAKGIMEGISALSPKALKTLERALDPEQETSRVSKESAEYVISMLEGKPTQKQEVEHSGGIDLGEDEEQELDDMLGHLDDNPEDEAEE